MSTSDQVKKAVADGVISEGQAKQLNAYMAGESKPNDADIIGDPENLKFLSSFNDIFLTMGLLILLTGVFIAAVIGFLGWPNQTMIPVLVGGCVAACSWALAEYFGARRRLALPTMALAAVFAVFAGAAFGALMLNLGFSDLREDFFRAAAQGDNADREIMNLAVEKLFSGAYWSQLGAMLAAMLFYLRFKLPFSLFLLAVVSAIAFYTFLVERSELSAIGGGAILFAGCATLFAAMTFDAVDPSRLSRQSDNAFWLHMAAAPQIMIGLRFLIMGPDLESDMWSTALMLMVLIGVGLLSLALNRRALIFSGLVTFTLAVFSLTRKSGLSGIELVMWPLLIVGTSVVLLGAGWSTARTFVLSFVPKTGIFACLFPSEDTLKGGRFVS